MFLKQTECQPKSEPTSSVVESLCANLDALMKDGVGDEVLDETFAKGLERLKAAFRKHYPECALEPHFIPTSCGVEAEWTWEKSNPNAWPPTLEINLLTLQGDWMHCNLDLIGVKGAAYDDESESRVLDLTAPGDWSWLVAQLDLLQKSSTLPTPA